MPVASRLSVLISAYACEPGRGSEPGVGWNLVRELSARHDLAVITRANNRPAIEHSGESWVGRVEWIYYDPPRSLTFWKRGGRGVQLFYILWQVGVGRLARRLARTRSFDLIHHVTFGRYWIPSPLASLGMPFVFGPVGGGESSPPGLRGSGGIRGRAAECAKSLMRRLVGSLPPTRRLLRDAAWTFAATPQTAAVLHALGVANLSVLPQSGIRAGDLPDVPQPAPPDSLQPRPFRLIAASRLIHWKGIDLIIEALARLPPELDVILEILQDGPERKRLAALAERLSLSARVRFLGKLATHAEVHARIADADALVHPALHEAFGQACLEALALGTPVICLAWGGPGMIVDKETGIAVRPGDRDQTISMLASAIEALAAERARGMSRSDACRRRAFEDFSWTKLAACISGKYYGILEKSPPASHCSGFLSVRDTSGKT